MAIDLAFLPSRDKKTVSVCEDIVNNRKIGRIRAQILEVIADPAMLLRNHVVTALDAFAVENGLFPLEDAWQEVSEVTALQIITRLLHQDLAYQTEIMPVSQAQALAARFFERIHRNADGRPSRCFTNGDTATESPVRDIAGQKIIGWLPATEATFDTGIIAIADSTIGLIWVMDED